MVDLLHDLALVDDGFDLLLACQLVLSHYFHCVEASSVLFADEDNSTEGTSANYFYLFEVMSCNFHLLVCNQGTLSEGQLGEVSPQELVVLED